MRPCTRWCPGSHETCIWCRQRPGRASLEVSQPAGTAATGQRQECRDTQNVGIVTTGGTRMSEFEIEMFTCERHTGGLRLTRNACATSYRRHQRPEHHHHPCHRCELGAQHAGAPPPGPAPSRTCAWCGAQGRRLVFKVICVSCYNRARELATGRFRRASATGVARHLKAYKVVVDA